MAQINIANKKQSSVLDAIGTIAGTVGTVAGAANGASDLLKKFNAQPSTANPTSADALAKTAMPDSKPMQSDVGGTLGNAITRRYKQYMEMS